MAIPSIRIERINAPTWQRGEDINNPPSRIEQAALVEPETQEWGLWLDENGKPVFFSYRDPETGAIKEETWTSL